MLRIVSSEDSNTDNIDGVLLLHGLTGTSAELRILVTQLHQKGFEVAAPHIEGMGDGLYTNDHLQWRDWLAQAEAAFKQLAAKCETVHIVGFCLGGLLGLMLAAEGRMTSGRLVLLCPMLRADGWAIPRGLRWFSLVQARWLARFFAFTQRQPFGIKDKRVRNLLLGELKGGDSSQQERSAVSGTKVLEFRRLSRAVRRCLGDIDIPTLIIHSREDDKASPTNATEIARRLSGPVELNLICDSYHIVTLDRQRHQVAQLVLAFLNSSGSTGVNQALAFRGDAKIDSDYNGEEGN